jgi:hypothetical protein
VRQGLLEQSHQAEGQLAAELHLKFPLGLGFAEFFTQAQLQMPACADAEVDFGDQQGQVAQRLAELVAFVRGVKVRPLQRALLLRLKQHLFAVLV